MLRTLYVLDLLSNKGLGTVIVAHHTGILPRTSSHNLDSYRKLQELIPKVIDCGMINETDDSLRAKMKRKVPEKAEEIETMQFGCFTKRSLAAELVSYVKSLIG